LSGWTDRAMDLIEVGAVVSAGANSLHDTHASPARRTCARNVRGDVWMH
jgi:hypothetical protein